MQTVLKKERKSNLSETPSHGGINLAFALGNKEYGIEILNVRKIIGIINLMPLPLISRYVNGGDYPDHFPREVMPKSDSYVKGILQFMGQRIPLIDLRLKLGLREAAYTIETCIIIVKIEHTLKGVIVDKILDVFDIRGKEIEAVPLFEDGVNTEVSLGMVTVKDTARILLDINRVLNTKEINKELKKIKVTACKNMLLCE